MGTILRSRFPIRERAPSGHHKKDFAKRENKLIIEVARFLFHDQWIRKILAIPTGVSHAALLDIIDTYSMVVSLANVEDQDRRGILSSQIEEQVTKSPVFNLDELLKFVAARPGITAQGYNRASV
jgi:hypothetical protein